MLSTKALLAKTGNECCTMLQSTSDTTTIVCSVVNRPALGSWGSMLSVVDGNLAPVAWEDLDPALVEEIQHESTCYTLNVLKDQLGPGDVLETTLRGDGRLCQTHLTPPSPAMYLTLMSSQSLDYRSCLAQYTLRTTPIMTPSSSRHVWRKLNTPSILRLRNRCSP